jgi:hypothetical protein
MTLEILRERERRKKGITSALAKNTTWIPWDFGLI